MLINVSRNVPEMLKSRTRGVAVEALVELARNESARVSECRGVGQRIDARTHRKGGGNAIARCRSWGGVYQLPLMPSVKLFQP